VSSRTLQTALVPQFTNSVLHNKWDSLGAEHKTPAWHVVTF
jgi:hypothetical protein